jgi:hypothetical protein
MAAVSGGSVTVEGMGNESLQGATNIANSIICHMFNVTPEYFVLEYPDQISCTGTSLLTEYFILGYPH